MEQKAEYQTNETFDQWCIVEIMGRQVIAGRVTEQTIGGTAFIRVDVPVTDEQPAFTRFYGAGSIYAITPVSEEVVRIALNRFRPKSVNVYVPELNMLQASSNVDIEGGRHPGSVWEDDSDDDGGF